MISTQRHLKRLNKIRVFCLPVDNSFDSTEPLVYTGDNERSTLQTKQKPMNAIEESVLVIYNDKNEMIAISKRDSESRKTILYSVSEMVQEDIASLFKKNHDRA